MRFSRPHAGVIGPGRVRPLLPGRLLLVLAIAAPSTLGCWAARSAGGSLAAGAIARIEAEESLLVALQRRLADSAGSFLQREFATAVLHPTEQTWQEMRRGIREEADTMVTRLAAQVRGDLNESLQQLARDNLDVIDRRGAALTQVITDTFTNSLAGALTSSLAAAADTLTLRMASTVAVALEEVLQPALHAVMLDLRDSLRVRITDVDRAVTESRTFTDVRYILLGVGATVVLVVLAVAVTHWHRQRRALHALIDAVETAGDDEVRRAVHTCAEQQGVRGWLTDRVRARKSPPPH